MKNLKFLTVFICFIVFAYSGCKKETEPEPTNSKPHTPSKNDYDYYFKDNGGWAKVTKLAGTIVKTVQTYDYSFTANTYTSTNFSTSSSITKIQDKDTNYWSVKIYRFDRNSNRPDGDYNWVSISFVIRSQTMPTSNWTLVKNLDDTSKDSVVNISANYQKWMTSTQTHEAVLDVSYVRQITLNMVSYDPSSGLLKGNLNASGKDPDSNPDPKLQKDINISCEFEVKLVEVLK